MTITLAGKAVSQSIIMKIGTVTEAGGEEVKAADFRIDAATTYGTGGGTSVGVPKVSEFIVKKNMGKSTQDLYRKILAGTVTPEVIIEYRNADSAYLRITLKDVYISNFYWLSPECPTCIKTEHQIAFVPKKIETYDLITGVKVNYDVVTRVIN